MSIRAGKFGLAAAVVVVLSAIPAATAAADTTIGTDVNNTTGTTQGTCDSMSSAACVVTWPSLTQGGPLTSPCDGTVTQFRINAAAVTTAKYRLRVLHLNGTTATAVSASAAVPLPSVGVNLFPTNIPIHVGDQVGLEFMQPVAFSVVRYRTSGTTAYTYSNGIPDSGSAPATFVGTGINGTEYLVNADVACTQPAQTPATGAAATIPSCKKKKKKKHRDASASKKKRCKKHKKK